MTQLSEISGDLALYDNSKLERLEGLDALTSFSGIIQIEGNNKLTDLTKLVLSDSFTDLYPKDGDNLYRLKMIDNDASFSYSMIVNIAFATGYNLLP